MNTQTVFDAANNTEPTLCDADNHTKLKAISSTRACAEGRVLTLDFSAIQLRFGDRWAARREDVWPKLEAIIEHHAGSGSLWLRMLKTEYLVCFDQPAASAQAIGFRIMEEALTHFTGQSEPKNVMVNRVTSIEGDLVSRVPVKPGDAPPLPPNPGQSRSFAPELEALASPQHLGDTVDPLILSCGLQDIFNLKTGAVVGLRIEGRYLNQKNGRELTTLERAALSSHALVRMGSRIGQALPALFKARGPKTLVAPFSLHTFGTSRGRETVIDQLKSLDTDQRSRLIIELVGFEVGTPSSRLMEAASLLKPYCRYVGAQPAPTRTGVMSVINARFSAVSVSARELGGDGARLAAGILAFGEGTKAIAPRLIVTDLPSDAFLPICGAAGYTLATVSGDGRLQENKDNDQGPTPRLA